MDTNDIIKALEKEGYSITKTEPENLDIEKAISALKDQGFEVQKQDEEPTKETETETKSEEKSEEKSEPETKEVERTVKFVLGTPADENKSIEINEDSVMVMTPEQINENMPKIREYVLANGGKF